ncbi:MAG: hypothetical protein K2Q18_04505 [Bdellovibrionales bacterium]|nr:hypothetical protein [Bdellovibrionales bacterium]
MKKSVITLSLILTLGSILVSCSHQTVSQDSTPSRYSASVGCPVKGEYHSYFDEAEKCLERSDQR